MKNLSISIPREDQRKMQIPAFLAMLCLSLILMVMGLDKSTSTTSRWVYLVLAVGNPIYIAILIFGLHSFINSHRYLRWMLAVFHGVWLAFLTTPQAGMANEIYYVFSLIAIVFSSMNGGRWATYLMTFIATTLATITYLITGEPFPPFLFRCIALPLVAVIITETILRMQKALFRQLSRLETLNDVARKLASSLEIHEVISLVSEAIQNTLSADTYYVGLLTDENHLRLELFYDDGEFFPPMDLPLKNSLAAGVIRRRSSILLRNTHNDDQRSGATPVIIGKPRDSLSWMGAPLEASGRILGMVGVASYSKNAFETSDLELIENFAQLAAMAIDNAYHHNEVETKSKLDSLTGVYNHGSFLNILSVEAEKSRSQNRPLSLIMLDIDHFKRYNDAYGHLIGDQVLRLLIQAIRTHIKSTDYVGRWGGEEFIILLPNANGAETIKIANRIRQSLAAMHITDREQRTIPCPTISQGISVFPDDGNDIELLLDLADRRLYVAKERGRDQVEPTDASFWESQAKN
jgi:diguanylate cyclase (GGDEF)-like protein